MPIDKITQITAGSKRQIDYFVAVVMMNDFIDREAPKLTHAELQIALAIYRKTIGWGKFTEEIGVTELVRRTGLSRKTVRLLTKDLCTKLGIKCVQRKEGRGLARRQFTWPVSPQVAIWLAKGREKGELPPGPRWAPVVPL